MFGHRFDDVQNVALLSAGQPAHRFKDAPGAVRRSVSQEGAGRLAKKSFTVTFSMAVFPRVASINLERLTIILSKVPADAAAT